MKALIIALGTLAILWTGCDRGPREATPPSPRVEPGASDDVQLDTLQLAGNVYMLSTGRAGNIGVSVGDDGILIIDTQFAPMANQIRAALGAVSPGELQYVLNTHHHRDHTEGNQEFGDKATVIAHENVRERLVAGDTPRAGLPVITFDKSLTLHFNGEAVRAMHFARSHTDGDTVVLFETSNVVHLGDLMFNGRFPYVDIDSGGDPRGLTESIELLIGMLKPDVKIIPGHGPVATLDDLETYLAMLKETTELVRTEIAAGRSLAEIQKRGVPAKWQSWSWAFISSERWLATLHRALTSDSGT